MCLYLEMLLEKKCRNLSVCVLGEHFPVTVIIFPVSQNSEITCLSGICENITDDIHMIK